MTHDIGTSAEITLGSAGEIAVINFIRISFLHFLGCGDGNQSIHMNLGTVVGHILVFVTKVVVMIA